MKKKTLALLLALSCALTATACSSKKEDTDTAASTEAFAEDSEKEETKETETETEEVPDETETATSTAADLPAPEMSDNLFDFQVAINGTVYQFPMWYSDFEASGWTYEGDTTQTLSSDQYTNSDSWKKDDLEVLTTFANLSMNSAPITECMVAGISLDSNFLQGCDCQIILPGNIQYGVSTIDDIKAAYGEPSFESEGKYTCSLLYTLDSYQEVELNVSNQTNTLCKIEITNFTELEGTDNSVDTSVPDVAANYAAPSSLGTDLYSLNVELEGNLYTLPCPVSEFLANGFEINEENSDTEIAANSIGNVELIYNDLVLSSLAYNFSDKAATIENCFLTTIQTYYKGKTNFDITIPGDIKLGSSEDDVLKAIESFNYEREDNVSGYTSFEVYHPDRSILDGYEIIVIDGVVTEIRVANSENPAEEE